MTIQLRHRSAVFSLLAAVFLPLHASTGMARVEISTVCFPRPAEQLVVHEAICKDQTYRLRVIPKEKRVEFESNRQRSVLDISHTPFAAALLKRSHWGEVHMTCPEGGIRATFHGFRLAKGKAPVPVGFGVSIFDQEIRNHEDVERGAAEHVRFLIDGMDD